MSLTGGRLIRGELVRGILVTAAALLVYRAGLQIPMPGLEPNVVAQLSHAGKMVTGVSILGLEIYPLFSILILAELAMVLAPPLRRWEHAAPRNSDKLARIILIVALFFAVWQATGIAVSLDSAADLVMEPGLQFRLPAIATLVAGTAVVTWLAAQITRHGLGSGLWLIVTAPMLAELPYTISELLSYQAAGFVGGPNAVVGGAFIVISVAAVVALVSAGGQSTQLGAACLWPVVLAYTVLPWLLALGALFGQATGADASMPWMEFGHPVRLAVLAVLIGVFVFLYVRSNRLAGVAPPAVPPIVIGGTLAAIAVASEALPTYFSVPLILDGQSLPIITIVMTSILIDWGLLRRAG